MKKSNYKLGAYYYTLGVFMWGCDAIYKDPSIYCKRDEAIIEIPSLRRFLDKQTCPCMFIPFFSGDLKVKI